MAASAALLLSVGVTACGSGGGKQSVDQACEVLQTNGVDVFSGGMPDIDLKGIAAGEITVEKAIYDAVAPVTKGVTNTEVLDAWNGFVDAVVAEATAEIEGGTPDVSVSEAETKLSKLCPNAV